MKLVVGLGNPGRKYDKTRHNVGFEVLAELARRHDGGKPKAKFDGLVVEAVMGGESVWLLAPQTYMNASGRSVRAAVEFYKLPLDGLLVVCDDFHLPIGKLRLRAEGSAGGQKGLADIIRQLGTEEFHRLRIAVGPVPDGWDAADFVLGKFTGSQRQTIHDVLDRAADAVACWVAHGIDETMNQYN